MFPHSIFAGSVFPGSVFPPGKGGGPIPPPTPSKDGGGGDKRRAQEMSVEQWRVMQRAKREDDFIIQETIKEFLKVLLT